MVCRIIYPDSWPDMQARGRTDDDLLRILEHVHLAYLPSREGGLDTRKEWKDVLSGGEKQRVNSLARILSLCLRRSHADSDSWKFL